jgi:phospholipase D1/2
VILHITYHFTLTYAVASFISKMEENSGVKFQQALVALARQWVGKAPDGEAEQTNVTIVVPDENNTTATLEGPKNKLKTESYPLPRSIEEARDIIERFQHGADSLRSDEDVSDNVVQHMLHDRTSLLDEKWLGTEEEELNAYVSELLYIHSKVMIVDDRRVIVSFVSAQL